MDQYNARVLQIKNEIKKCSKTFSKTRSNKRLHSNKK